MDQRTSRFWDAFWVVAPLVVGGLIGFFLAGQFPASTTDCTALPASTSTSANFALAVVLVILLVSRIVLRSVIGPVAARAMTMAAIGLVVAACGSYFVGTRTEPCPTAGIASTHEAVVWTAPSALYIS